MTRDSTTRALTEVLPELSTSSLVFSHKRTLLLHDLRQVVHPGKVLIGVHLNLVMDTTAVSRRGMLPRRSSCRLKRQYITKAMAMNSLPRGLPSLVGHGSRPSCCYISQALRVATIMMMTSTTTMELLALARTKRQKRK